MRNDFSEEEYKSSNEEKDYDGETYFKDNIDNHNLTKCFNEKFTSDNKIIKISYYVNQILILKEENLLLLQVQVLFFFIKIITLN